MKCNSFGLSELKNKPSDNFFNTVIIIFISSLLFKFINIPLNFGLSKIVQNNILKKKYPKKVFLSINDIILFFFNINLSIITQIYFILFGIK